MVVKGSKNEVVEARSKIGVTGSRAWVGAGRNFKSSIMADCSLLIWLNRLGLTYFFYLWLET